MIDYTSIRLVHRVDGILNNEETARRLREVRACPYHSSKLCKALAKALEVKRNHMSNTEAETLREFPVQGMNLGNVSHALIFADPFRYMPIARHKAIVSLIRLGYLAIVEGYRVDQEPRQRMEQILVRVK